MKGELQRCKLNDSNKFENHSKLKAFSDTCMRFLSIFDEKSMESMPKRLDRPKTVEDERRWDESFFFKAVANEKV